jgi:hypothetical protein
MGMEGMEEEDRQDVAPSTAAREAYFVDFAKAMQNEVAVPLMVTGGFRSRAAMVQALEIGAADVIGLGRPMCLITDAPRQLLEGRETLPRFEDGLDLIPDWLSFLKRLQMLKAVNGFAGMAWFYQQLWLLGHTGHTDDSVAPLKAFMALEKRNKAILAARTG